MMNIAYHKLVDAEYIASPNVSSGTLDPIFIVMHYTASWEAESALDTFKSKASKVSAHLTVDTDGTTYQHVPFNKIAWHAGPSQYKGYNGLNRFSIGIEFVNPGFLRKVGDNLYQDSRARRVSGNDIPPLVETAYPRAGSGTFYFPVYTEDQMVAGESIVRSLVEKYNIIDIVTHEEIDTRGWKTDPGPAFPMNRFRALLRDRANDVVRYQVTASVLNVRKGPGAQFAVKEELRAGTIVEDLGRSGEWIKIGNDEWVHSGFVRIVT